MHPDRALNASIDRAVAGPAARTGCFRYDAEGFRLAAPAQRHQARTYSMNDPHMKLTVPVLGFAAFSGTGKTTLLEQLIPQLTAQGIRIGMVKHAHHEFDIDKPGKDSYRLRSAGARQILIASSKRQALMTENTTPLEPRLEELISRLDHDCIDLVLVEGFKQVPFAKIELHRQALGKTLLYPEDPNIIAVVSDHPSDCRDRPSLDINDTAAITAFIVDWLDSSPYRST